MSVKRIMAVAVTGLVGAAVVTAVFASTASNTVPNSKGGEGQGSISGYDVSSVHYELNSSDPTKIDAVTFSLDSAPVTGSSVKVKVGTAGSTWYTCTNTGVAVTCPTTSPQATVAAADSLKVVVAQ